MPVRRDRGDARSELDVAVGEAPVDAVVVVVDAAQRLGLGRPHGERVVELTALQVHRGVLGEPAQPAGMVVVQVAQRHRDHIVRVDPDQLERSLDGVAGVADQLVLDVHVGQPTPQLAVEQDRRVEPGVEQEPPAVHLQQDPRAPARAAARRADAPCTEMLLGMCSHPNVNGTIRRTPEPDMPRGYAAPAHPRRAAASSWSCRGPPSSGPSSDSPRDQRRGRMLAVAERRGRISEAQARRFLDLLAQLPIGVDTLPVDPDVVLGVCRGHGLSAHDAAYLLLAERTGAVLATLDVDLAAAARRAGVEVLTDR